VRIRLTPEDDFLHPLEEASNFNESRYYNFYDGEAGLGGWLRLGNRPNEGYAEMTTCLYLPNGSVAFMFGRPKVEGHTAHDAGGLRFEVLEPFARHRLSYEGQVLILDQPEQMEDPSAAFKHNRRADCQIDLDVRAIARPWGGEPEGGAREDPEKSFARGHTEQHIASTGTVRVGDDGFDISRALGLCDHSWGPRYWQAVWWYRWLTVNLGAGLGFATTITGTEAGEIRAHGFLYDVDRYGNDQWVPIRGVKLTSDYEQDYHRSLQVAVTTDDHVYDVEGAVWSRIPLRNRRNGLVTRITEGMTTWKYGDLTGAGLSEYLDQIVDGRPVGMATGM
jgi:hypothetical protein